MDTMRRLVCNAVRSLVKPLVEALFIRANGVPVFVAAALAIYMMIDETFAIRPGVACTSVACLLFTRLPLSFQ